MEKSQLVRRKALQALAALCDHAPLGDEAGHAVQAAKQLVNAVWPHLLAYLSAPPDSPLASEEARQVSSWRLLLLLTVMQKAYERLAKAD